MCERERERETETERERGEERLRVCMIIKKWCTIVAPELSILIPFYTLSLHIGVSFSYATVKFDIFKRLHS